MGGFFYPMKVGRDVHRQYREGDHFAFALEKTSVKRGFYAGEGSTGENGIEKTVKWEPEP